jgi:hypothetical protein
MPRELVGKIAVNAHPRVLSIVVRVRKRTTAKRKRLVKPPERSERPRRSVVALPPLATPAATPVFGVPVTIGSIDSNDWLRARGIAVHKNLHWFVEIALGIEDEPVSQLWSGATDTRFQIYIYPQEWGFLFCHRSRASWIRVADRAYVHGRDDYGLVAPTPTLRDIAALVRALEQQHQLAFRRDHVLVRTNLAEGEIEERVREWVLGL